MSTSIISLHQNFNANDVDIVVFEPCLLFHPRAGIRHMVHDNNTVQTTTRNICRKYGEEEELRRSNYLFGKIN